MRYFAMRNDSNVRLEKASEDWCGELVQSNSVCVYCRRSLPGSKFGKVVLRGPPKAYYLNSIDAVIPIRYLKKMEFSGSDVFVGGTRIALLINGWIVGHDLLILLNGSAAMEVIPIFLASGEKLKDFQFVMPERLLVRGGARATISGVCVGCGKIAYWPGREADEYILRPSISVEKPVYGLWTGGMALREDVYERILSKKFPGLNFYELPIRDEPEDGLPPGLKPYVTPEEQAAMVDILWRDAHKDRRLDHGGQWLPWKIKPHLLNPRPEEQSEKPDGGGT